jgi:TIR domain
MARIFISYRRTDAGGHAGRLHNLLSAHYREEHIFFDVAGIEDGRNWKAEIKKQLEACEVLLVVIGADWLSARDPNSYQRRIDQAGDWVRLEVETGMAMDKVVIPVLVDGAKLPASKDYLPTTMQNLLKLQAREIPHKGAELAVGLLVEQINQRFPASEPQPKAEQLQETSSDLLAQKSFAAVERLWDAVLDLKKSFGKTLLFFGTLFPSEFDSAIDGPGSFGADLRAITDLTIIEAGNRVEDVESHRLYFGDDVWALFFTYRSFLMRLAYLLISGKRKGHIVDWRDDKPLKDMLSRVMPPETIKGLLEPKEDITAVYRAEGLLQSLILAKIQLITSGRHKVHADKVETGTSRINELRRELEPLIENFVAAGSSGNAQLLQRAWNTWIAWLQANRLQFLPRNQKILNTWAIYGDKFHAASTQANVALWAERIAQQVKETQLCHD